MSRRPFVLLFLAAVLVVTAHAKTESWVRLRSPHFVVLSNSGEKQARRIAGQFERMRAVFHRLFPQANVDGASPIIVIALNDKKDFQALEPEAYLAKGQLNLAGFFLRVPDKNYVVLRLDVEGQHPYATVYHEYTHFILSRAEGWLPLWLNEGLAEFYQNTDITGKEVLLGEPSAENLILLRQNRLLPLTTLFAVDHDSPYYHEEDKGSIFYAESWALTHYLRIKDRQENTDRLMDYARLVSNKVDAVTAASRVFGDLKVLEKNLERYVAQARFFQFKMTGSINVDESTFTSEAVTVAQADATRADFLAYNQRVKEARALLDRVLREDANNVAARETMGFLAFREGDLEEAGKWYEQAVKLDSQSFLAHYYYAAIAIRQGLLADRAGQIETSLRAATKLNPLFAPAFDRLAVFYGMQHKNLDEAHTLSLMAIQLDPGEVGYRIDAANILLEMERPADAIAALQNALQVAATPSQTAAIQNQLESVRHFQAEREREQAYREASQPQGDLSSAPGDQALADSQALAHAEDDRHGPQRTIRGTLRDVQCSAPATMRLRVEGAAKRLDLRTRNYYKIRYSALNFTPSGDLNPCTDLEGMKAKVEYFEGLGPAEGQILSVELTK
jgi:tetratricopeptide (TPR) repeat protein